MSLDRTLQRVWYRRSPRLLFLALVPLSLLFAILAAIRRSMFRLGLRRSVRVGKPIIVVGNISVGGTGKTPLVIWIADWLRACGVQVGVITRGYGGRASTWPQVVSKESDPREVGDEAVLIASRTGAIVVAGPDRVVSAARAVELGAQVVVSDDGLQHYRLARDLEIVALDAQRRLGNGWLLPAGPLRERASRLRKADLVIATDRLGTARANTSGEIVAHHRVAEAQCIATGVRRSLADFRAHRVHAVAGIGNPDAFFSMLREHGLQIEAHALADHAAIAVADITFDDDAPVLMTEKDAVKCVRFATDRHWAVCLEVGFDPADTQTLASLLRSTLGAPAHSSGSVNS